MEAAGAGADGLAVMQAFMADRARELHAFLAQLVAQEALPPAKDGKGGVVLVSWSWGATWLTAFIANLRTFPAGEVDLSQYVRRMVVYGA